MGVVAARLLFLAFLGLTGSIIYNALYLQDLHGPTIVATPQGAPASSSVEMATLPPVSTDLPPLDAEKGGPQLVVRDLGLSKGSRFAGYRRRHG